MLHWRTPLDAYLSAEPAQDERFVAVVAPTLEHRGFSTPHEAHTAARVPLPDALRYDHRRPVETAAAPERRA